MFICVCIALRTIVAHNIAQNRPDNFPSYPPDNHHCSDDVYLREALNTSDNGSSHYPCLKTADEVHEERMPHGVHDLKDVFLRHEALHLVTSENVRLLQRFYRKVLAGRQMLRQYNLRNHGRATSEL